MFPEIQGEYSEKYLENKGKDVLERLGVFTLYCVDCCNIFQIGYRRLEYCAYRVYETYHFGRGSNIRQ